MLAAFAASSAGASPSNSRGASRMTSDAARDEVLDVRDLLGGLALRVGDDELVLPRFAASAFMLAVCAIRQGLLCSICEKPTTNARSCRRQPPVERAITAATVPHMVFRQRRRRVMRPDVGRSRGAGLETGCAKWRNQRVCPGQTACQEPTRRTRTHSATPEDCYALSSRAALAIADTFAAAISAVFIGRFENVPKPQSGLRKIRSAGRVAARARRPPRSPRPTRPSSVRGLTTPSPSSLPAERQQVAGALGRVLEHELLHVHALEVRGAAAGSRRAAASTRRGSSCRGRRGAPIRSAVDARRAPG